MNFLVISTSLNTASRSRLLAEIMHQRIGKWSCDAHLIDLKDLPLPLCDGDACYSDPAVQKLAGAITGAHGVVIATPVYNYDVSASAKNLIELTGKAWMRKVVAFVCAAGGMGSYMSVMGLANSLMLDFHSFILPDFVFATGKAFDETGKIIDQNVDDRLTRLADTLVRITGALHAPADARPVDDSPRPSVS